MIVQYEWSTVFWSFSSYYISGWGRGGAMPPKCIDGPCESKNSEVMLLRIFHVKKGWIWYGTRILQSDLLVFPNKMIIMPLGGQKQIRTKMASYIYYLSTCNSQAQVFFPPPETTLMVRASIAVGHKGLSNMRLLLFIVFDRPISYCLKPVAAGCL